MQWIFKTLGSWSLPLTCLRNYWVLTVSPRHSLVMTLDMWLKPQIPVSWFVKWGNDNSYLLGLVCERSKEAIWSSQQKIWPHCILAILLISEDIICVAVHRFSILRWTDGPLKDIFFLALWIYFLWKVSDSLKVNLTYLYLTIFFFLINSLRIAYEIYFDYSHLHNFSQIYLLYPLNFVSLFFRTHQLQSVLSLYS